MKRKDQVMDLLESTTKKKEIQLGSSIRNGQHLKGIKDTLLWVLDLK